ncbi:MAG: chromate efflux transporter [Myxococcales bacterium]|nr:chromate efflux transporter [Myxococcales bacterium]
MGERLCDKALRMPESLLTIAWVFTKLGCLSFGGPIAHLGFLHAEFVERRRWVDEAHFSDLVALCQFLPGPASSQLVFALGMTRRGLPGALVASLCFTAPSLGLMIAFASGVAHVTDLHAAGWLHGLKLAAVVVVAQAVWSMGKKLCPDRERLTVCLAATALVLAVPHALTQVALIGGGGVVGWLRYRKTVVVPAVAPAVTGRHRVAAGALLFWAAALIALPVLTELAGSRSLAHFSAFYRSGSLVFGGGHVVLPLLRAEVVPTGWLTDDRFLAGYAAAQALPGPLFTFAGYLGAAMASDVPAWLNGLWCALAIFLPAWLLIGGALPFWQRLRARASAQAVLMGANASVVGVLLAALYEPVFTSAVRAPADGALVVAGFALLEAWRTPPGLLVIAFAVAGQWLLQ